jgi:alpha-glucosidase
MVSDSPQTYAGQPSFQFIKDVPVSWDASHVLDGRPGEFTTIARKNGDEWYLGSMTNWTPRTLEVPLSFLGSGAYTAQIYEDAADAATNPKHVTIRKQTVHAAQTLTLHLAPGGGCAIRFIPQKGR